MSHQDIANMKAASRKHFNEIRNFINYKAGAAEKLKNNFLKNIDLDKISIISSYIPIKSEIDVLPLNLTLDALGKSIVMPVEDKVNNVLIFKKCNFIKKKPILCEAILEPDLLIVPMLAFDADLMRLGYGKGWYDKTILNFRNNKNNNKKLLIGVAYNIQFSNISLPRDDFDQILDTIVTEEQCIWGF